MPRRHRSIIHSALVAILTVGMSVAIGIGSQHPEVAKAATNITVSGFVFDGAGDPLDCSSGTLTVRVKVNGAGSYSGTCNILDSSYSIGSVSVNPNDIVTIFLDDTVAHEINIWKIHNTTPVDITSDLYDSQIFVNSQTASQGAISFSDFDLYDRDQNTNIEFKIDASNVFTVYGSTQYLTLNNVSLSAGQFNASVLNITANDSTLSFATSGSVIASVASNTNASVSFNTDTSADSIAGFANGIITYSGTPTVTTTSMSDSTNTMSFYNLSSKAGFGTFSVTSKISVANNLSIASGTVATFYRDSTIVGNLTTTGTASILYATTFTTPTVTVQGTSLGGGSGDIKFYNLTKSGSNTDTWTGSGTNVVANTLAVNGGTLVAPSSLTVNAITQSGGTFDGSASTVLLTGTGTQTLSGTFANLSINKGLVGHWKLDETSIGSVADSSGYGSSGTHTGSPTIDSSVPTTNFTNARSVSYNGTSQYTDLGNTDAVNLFTDKFAIAAWIKPATLTGTRNMVGKSYTTTHADPYYTYTLFQIGNQLSFRVSSGSGASSTVLTSSGSGTGALSSGVWQHIAGTYDGTTMKIYINGVEVGSAAKTGNILATTQSLRIGANSETTPGEYYSGNVDDVRLYRRPLSADEVRTLADGNDWGFSGATTTLAGALTVSGDLNIYDGTIDVDNTNNYAVNVGGTWNNVHGVFQSRNGTVSLNGTASGKSILSGRQHFNNLTVSGSGGVWTLADRLYVDGTLAVSNGTLDVSTSNYAVHVGTVNQTGGTITSRSGTIIADSTSSQTFTATSSFNNLRFEDPTETNLGGYWKFDMGHGTTTRDRSGNGRDGTLTNAPSWISSSLNSTTTYDNPAAIDFDGTDDYVSMGDVLDVNDTDNVTISGWFNRDTATTDDVIVAKRNGNAASDVGYIVWIDASTDKLRFEASDGTDEFELASVSTFTTTGWHHFVVIWDQASSSNSKIFIDGSDNSATTTGTIGNVNDLSNALALRIGAESDAGAPFDGKIDDVRIYTAALSTTQAANLGAGKYADGSAGTATFTLGGGLTVGGTLSLDSGTLATSSSTFTVTNALTLASGNGVYSGGSATQTLNGGLTVSGSTFTGGSGTLDVNGSVTLSGGTVTTGAGNWTVSGSYTHSGSTMTYTSGNTLTMDGTGTLTSNAQTLQNLSINSSGTVTLAAATHTVAGNLLLGGSGTPTVTGSTISMTGANKTIDGGNKALANLTIGNSSGTISLQNTDLTVNTVLTVNGSGGSLTLNSGRTLMLSRDNASNSLTLNGTINGPGRLTYQNATANAFPTTGTLASVLIVRYDTLNGNLTTAVRTDYGTLELVNSGTTDGRTVTLGNGAHSLSGNFDMQTATTGNLTVQNTNNVTVSVTGNVTTTSAVDAVTFSAGLATWNIGGNFDLTNVTTFNHNSGTIKMTGTANLIGNGKTLNHLTIDGSGTTVTVTTSDITVAGTLTVGGAADGNNDTLSIGTSRTLTSSTGGTVTIVGSGTDSISGSGLLVIQNSNLGSLGTLTVPVRFDATSGTINMPARAYGGNVEIYNNSGVSARSVVMQSGSHTLSGNLSINAANTQNTTLSTSGNPTVGITGDLSFPGVGGGTNILNTGSGPWTISGNVDFENGSVTITSLTMDGVGKTLKGNDQVISTLTIAGSITLTSSDLFTSTLNVNASSTYTISTGRFNNAFAAITINSTGTIDGGGSLYVVDATLNTVGTLSSNVYFQATAGDYTIPNRAFTNSSRTVTLDSQGFSYFFGTTSSPISIDGDLFIQDAPCGGCVYSADTNDPSVTVGGNVTADNGITATLALGSGTWSVGGNFDMTNFITVSHNNGTVAMTGTSKTLTTNGFTLNNLTTSGTIAVSGTTILSGNLTISSGTLTAPSSTLTIGGSFDNNGTYAANDGTLVFNASSTGKTLELGSSTYNNVQFNSSSGGWTLQTDDPIIAGNLSLTAASSWTLQSGRTLTVQGVFANAVGGSATTWTGSTLAFGGTHSIYEINTKTTGEDSYGSLQVGSAEHLVMWNSDASSVTVISGGSLLSQDNGGVDGRLNVYGTNNSRSSEYWAYATDFDGTALGGSSRQVDVRFANGSSMTVDVGETLAIVGQSLTSNRTLVSALSGSYSLTINGTINAQNYSFLGLSTNGLVIGSTATVTDLSNGTFDNSAGGANASYISVSGISSSQSFTNVVFDANSNGADSGVTYNVTATGSGISWSFIAAAGNKAGAQFERELSSASIAWSTQMNNLNDGSGSDVDATNDATQLAGNWSMNLMTGVNNFVYAIGTTAGGTEYAGFTSTSLTPSFTLPGQVLISGTTYYITVRALDPNGEIIVQQTSDGLLVDTSTPLISNVVADPTDTTVTITWTTNEGATSQVEYGLTNSYGSTTVLDSTLVTTHAVALTGLTPETLYHFRVLSSDVANNSSASLDTTVTTDAASSNPGSGSGSTIISDVRVVAGELAVTILWSTNEAATSRIYYGPTNSLGSVVSDATAVTSHRLQLSGLQAGTLYYYQLESIGNSVATTSVASTSTNTPTSKQNRAIGPTLFAPLLRDGQHPTVTVIGLARGGDKVRVYVDGESIATLTMKGLPTQVKPFATRINLDDFANGKHTLYVQSTDTFGRTSYVRRKVTFTLTHSGADRGLLTKRPTDYVVQAGDSMWSIAERYLGDGRRYPEIVAANISLHPLLRILPTVILPGWVLRIPSL